MHINNLTRVWTLVQHRYLRIQTKVGIPIRCWRHPRPMDQLRRLPSFWAATWQYVRLDRRDQNWWFGWCTPQDGGAYTTVRKQDSLLTAVMLWFLWSNPLGILCGQSGYGVLPAWCQYSRVWRTLQIGVHADWGTSCTCSWCERKSGRCGWGQAILI